MSSDDVSMINVTDSLLITNCLFALDERVKSECITIKRPKRFLEYLLVLDLSPDFSYPPVP